MKAGWTAGAGIAGAFGGGWSAKLDYLYVDLGKTEFTIATPGLGDDRFGDPPDHRQHRARRPELQMGRRLLSEGVIEGD